MDWPHVPILRDEAYKSKPPRPTLEQPLEVPPAVSPEVIDEAEALRLARALGEVAGREATA